MTVLILITGGTGFLGSHLFPRLMYKRTPDSVVVTGRRHHGDLRDEMFAERLFLEFRPKIVVHLAAMVGGIGANQASPGRFFRDNMQMGMNVLEMCRKYDEVEKLVIMGTVCSYPKWGQIPFRESEIWEGYPEETNAPYGIAKRSLMVMAQAYKEQYGLNYVFAIPTNLYGPGDKFDEGSSHVIPALIKKFVSAVEEGKNEVVVWGDGSATREFLYVDDAVDALELLIESSPKQTVYNLGSGYEIRIQELAREIAGLCGYGGSIVYDVGKPNGQPRRRVSTERIYREFGWESKVRFEDGLKKTIEWYKESLQEAAR